MQITTILAFYYCYGRSGSGEWIVRYIFCRKTDVRKEEASVCNLEEETDVRRWTGWKISLT